MEGIDLEQLIDQMDETKNINNDFDKFMAIRDHLSISTLQRIFKLSYPKAKQIIDGLVECGAIEQGTYKLLSTQKYKEYLVTEKVIKYKSVYSFTPYLFDFVENYLLKDDVYVSMFDKAFNRNLSKMTLSDRQEKFVFLMQSGGNVELCLFLTHSYLAFIHKHSGCIDYNHEEITIPLIEEMLKDYKIPGK